LGQNGILQSGFLRLNFYLKNFGSWEGRLEMIDQEVDATLDARSVRKLEHMKEDSEQFCDTQSQIPSSDTQNYQNSYNQVLSEGILNRSALKSSRGATNFLNRNIFTYKLYLRVPAKMLLSKKECGESKKLRNTDLDSFFQPNR